jgi:putative endonuclease
MTGYVYMIASQKRGTIYIGVTNSLGRRMPRAQIGSGIAIHIALRRAEAHLV